MNMLQLNHDEQLESMLNGTFFDLLKEHGQDPWQGDFRRFITVDRQQLIRYLRLHPGKAEMYFEKYKSVGGVHDVATISKNGPEYVVAWIDRGQVKYVRRFGDIAEAVAEHVLINHGKY